MNPPSPLERFLCHTVESLQTGTFVRLLLSVPSVAAIGPERVIGRLVDIRGTPVLSLTLREATRDTTHNLPLATVEEWLKDQLPGRFRSAMLETTEGNWQLGVVREGRMKLVAHRPTQASAPSRQHDQAKRSLLDARALPWLVRLGVCTPDGRVRASMADKHRQLARYLEILSHLIRDAGWRAGDFVRVVDMGSGKGYLTFGVWHLIHHVLGLHGEVVGVEARRDLVEKTAEVARAIGAETLRFVTGVIADVPLSGVDLLIALHACNTATDDAIRRGIIAGARMIIVSPCCHQEIRPRLGRPEPLGPLLEHGIMAERFAEWLTDGLRALHLTAAGYETRIIEFVSSEHTPRNLLIAGVRQPRIDDELRAHALEQIRQLKAFAGVERQALDSLLEPRVGPETSREPGPDEDQATSAK